MKYMGSKRRIARDISSAINRFNNYSDAYYEPFVGGFNVAQYINAEKIFASDYHFYLIKLYEALQSGWIPPYFISEKEYTEIQVDMSKYPAELVGYVGFSLSFGAKFFGGYRHDVAGDRSVKNEELQNSRARKNVLDLLRSGQFRKAKFACCEYGEIEVVPGSIVYCDPPYFGTTGYKTKFNHEIFWEWVKNVSLHSVVLVSEYNAPHDFDIVWEGSIPNTLNKNGSSVASEKLFIWKGCKNV